MDAIMQELKSVLMRVATLESKVLDLRMENASLREEVDTLKKTEGRESTRSSHSRPPGSEVKRLQSDVTFLQKRLKALEQKQIPLERRLSLLDGLQRSLNKVYLDSHHRALADKQTEEVKPTSYVALSVDRRCQELEKKVESMDKVVTGSSLLSRLQGLEIQSKDIEAVSNKTHAIEKIYEELSRKNEIVSRLGSSSSGVLQSKVDSLELKVKSFQDISNRTGTVEKKCDELSKKYAIVYQLCSDGVLQKKIQELESKVKSVQSVSSKAIALEKKCSDMQLKIGRISVVESECVVMQQRLESLRISDVNHQIKALEKQCSSMKLINFWAMVNTSQAFTAQNVFLKLDKCKRTDSNISKIFNLEMCCVEPKQDGIYAVAIKMCQDGEGQIQLKLKRLESEVYEGKTKGHCDVINCFDLLKLYKGEKIWLEAQRISGQCKIEWCIFTGWSVSLLQKS